MGMEDIGRRFIQGGGDPFKGMEYISKGQERDPYKGLSQDYATFLRGKEIPNSPEAYAAWQQNVLDQKRAGATNVTTNVGGDGVGDQELAKSLLTNAPKLQETAQQAVKSAARIDRTIDLLDKHGDDITGISGAIKRGLAPYATAMGLNIGQMDDAQILNALLTEGQGSMRLAVIGPGPVSEYEQKILEQVSGKKIAAAEGIKMLLEHRQNQLYSDIDNYNNNTDALSKFYEKTEIAYPKIKYNKRGGKNGGAAGKSNDAPPVKDAQKAPDGNWYVERNGKFYRVEQ
jgi:hypothetical protein